MSQLELSESNIDRQKNELAVLKSIFGDELQDLRKNKQKKKWQPLDISITLTPQTGMSGPSPVYAQIDLRVTCGEEYPEEVPRIQVQNTLGLSHNDIAVLVSEIEALAQNLRGEVMIFELAQHVRKFLCEHNKPGFNSFYEEMMLRKQEKIQFEMQEKQMKEDKERQVLQDEIQKRQEVLKAELRNRKETARLSLDSESFSRSIPSSPRERVRTYSRRRCMSTSESFENSSCEHRGTKLIRFDCNKGERQVHRGKCLGHSTKGSVVYAALDKATGELLAVTEWSLKYTSRENNGGPENPNDLQHCMKQIGTIEQELNHLYKLHHSNLVHYLNMKSVADENCIVIYILQEFVVGTTCSLFFTDNTPVGIDMLRHLATGILSALHYLHENNVVHKDIRDSTVHIDRSGIIKLSDYSLDKRLSDVYQASCLAKTEDDFPTIQGRSGKKLDIYRFGILLLSLLKGYIVSEKELDLDSTIQANLKDFLSKCLVKDERNRWSTGQLLEHSFIRTPLDRGLSPPRQNQDKEEDDSDSEEAVTAVHIHPLASGGQSRIHNEFEAIKWLGKGAFGDVLKVKNKLDGCVYAIKRIKLNPKNKQLNRKITREVKLLSRLHHENVVRYYNSWIESATLDDRSLCSDSTPVDTPSNMPSEENTREVVDQLGSGEIEKLAPPIHDVEWNVSYESRVSARLSEDSEEDENDDSSDCDEEWALLMGRGDKEDSSDGIEFEKVGESNNIESASNSNKSEGKSDPPNGDLSSPKIIQFMYIQMEFCEKSTLRTAIDSGLYQDEDRAWRLFREIGEGLGHIHRQGMIHRDLKPVNIFLDRNDHVKIGDFGLATTNILSSLTQTVEANREPVAEKAANDDQEDLGSLTGEVGTALYVAPELTMKTTKAIYNQKVDIYSLGIIFFEMFYKPPETGMERVQILLNVRSKDIILPEDMTEADMPNQVHLLRWLLNHDPSQRPTVQELLASEYLPQSKAYKNIVDRWFTQEFTPAEDITFDMNLTTKGVVTSLLPRIQFYHQRIKAKVVKVFLKHGGVYLTTPFLMPKSAHIENYTENCVKMMTRSGSIVSMPYDLRVPFARYVVWNNIQHVRRYAIERVFRETKVHGFHPRELFECAFDVISPASNNLMEEAEMISIVYEITSEIPEFGEKNFTVRLNHTSLLQAVLMYCGIDSEKYQDIYSILCDARDGKISQFQVQTHLISLCLTDQAVLTLFNLLETENSIEKIAGVLKTITRRKGDAAALAREGLREVETVIANAEALGVKWPITVVPLLVHNIEQHSGIIYQIITRESKRRRKGGQDVIAAGGRYDKLLMSIRQVLKCTPLASKELKQSGVGIRISLDKLISLADELGDNQESRVEGKFAIVVCCVGGIPKREKEMAEVLRELYALDFRVTFLDLSTAEEVMDYCLKNAIDHVVMLKSGEKGVLMVQTWDKDRFQERKISIHDLTEYLQKQTEFVTPTLNRSESKTNTNNEFSTSIPVNVNINFVLADKDKFLGSGRKSYKTSILTQMSSLLQRISHKVRVEVFAVFLELAVLRSITNFLDVDEEENIFEKSIQVVIDMFPRHKEHIKLICEEIRQVRNEKNRPAVILYSLTERRFMTLI